MARGFARWPGVGLISRSSAKPLRMHVPRRCASRRGQRLAGPARGCQPATGVDVATGFAPRPVTRRAALVVAGAVQRGVVQQERHAVGAELHVALEGAVAVLRRTEPESRQCVLGRQLAGTTVRQPARGSVQSVSSPATSGHAHAGSQRRTSATCSGRHTQAAPCRPALGGTRVPSMRNVNGASADAAVDQPLGAQHFQHRPRFSGQVPPAWPAVFERRHARAASPASSGPLRGAGCRQGQRDAGRP